MYLFIRVLDAFLILSQCGRPRVYSAAEKLQDKVGISDEDWGAIDRITLQFHLTTRVLVGALKQVL